MKLIKGNFIYSIDKDNIEIKENQYLLIKIYFIYKNLITNKKMHLVYNNLFLLKIAYENLQENGQISKM